MAIKTDDSSISVNFVYRDDGLNEDFTIKLHCVEGLGKAISINGEVRQIDDNGVEFLSFPVQLLVETVDYLRSQGYLKLSDSSAAVVPTPFYGTQVSAVRGEPGGVLPVPVLGQNPVKQIFRNEETKVILPAGPPLQSLSSGGSLPVPNEGTMISGDGEVIIENEGDEDVEMEPIGDTEVSKYHNIAEERKAAAEKVGDVEGRVARPVRVDYGQQMKEKIERQADADYNDYEEC